MNEPWVHVPDGSGFGLAHLPLGVGEVDGRPRVVTRVGDRVLAVGDVVDDPACEHDTVNALLARGRLAWRELRDRLREHLCDREKARDLPHANDMVLRRPVDVGDYVDFYSSLEHATRVGRLFRPDAEPLLPNWRHLPVGYHGRSGTVVVSGDDVRRPVGLVAGEGGPPLRRPSAQLDFEVEVGFVVGPPAAGPVAVDAADDHVVGLVLVNDWSARDLQSFEYQPLGPFLGKSFATSISPWVVPLDALVTVPAPIQDPAPDPYLVDTAGTTFDLELTAAIGDTEVCRTASRHLYWTHRQQFAHLVSNGATARTGDLLATGTISGPDATARGCLLEATERGRHPVPLADGGERAWLADGDVVTIAGTTVGVDGEAIDLGAVEGRVLPATHPGGSPR